MHMLPMKPSYITFILFSFAICSCVFSPSKENFMEVETDVQKPVITDQILDLNADTLFVWKYTRFNFNLTAGKVPIHATVVNYCNVTLSFASGTGSFDVNPSGIEDGTYKVEIKAYTGSGTGSLADKLGAEGYEFTRSWVLIVEKPKPSDQTITTSIENGFLKFTWTKVDKPFFKSYQFYIQNNGINTSYSGEYKNPELTSFVDSSYVGGNITFTLKINYLDENDHDAFIQKQISYDFPITIKYKEDNDSLRITWNKNPFRCTKSITTHNGSFAYEINSDTTFIMAAPGLGDVIQYDLVFKPLVKFPWSHIGYHNYSAYTLGTNNGFKHSNVEYNPLLNSYFFKHPMSMKSANSRLEIQGAYNYSWDYGDNYTIDFSKNNQNIFTTVEPSLITLNSQMELINTVPLPFKGTRRRALKNLDDKVFLIGTDSFLLLYDANERKVLAKTQEMYGVLQNFNFSVSSDGKYAAFCNPYLYVYEIKNNQELILHYQDTATYYSCLFDPKYPEKLVLNCPDNMKIFNCATLKMEKTIDRFYANPVNIDPVTHNMLLVSNSRKKIYVYDYESDKIKFEMNHHALNTDFKLLNNIIFVSSGFHLDISSYVN
jgi:hypothetical protein